ncbi:putative SnaP protein (soluble N-ethylmaleimide-sensitive factor Attachment Protein) [Cardiosporidium cionae]|uniref:SnaP protein (Soluble N-ethylmaleimide-sensitive factor Attachment Protein) n=1 Tax=Cardiosporidium cionae TaxID=476202 RepID=A0ABQ7J9T8_9APIC|nr:putative SnaP protein (soluble N-ethylmaleimide-sensitive factor Attachment Protein) [Cardiosporidium cionae]|eukprot:KAF8820737.1 putative SnaP protein (soluble N-ethylmaleimide-sensitive factor Attachment Protein) [Cardiosporidium cionae]
MGESPQNLESQAEKKLQGGFFSFLSGGARFDEACTLFVSAGNGYKLKKQWENASKCYVRAAGLQSKLNDRNQEAGYYVEAGNITKKYSSAEAEKFYNNAIEIYLKEGRFTQSAKLLKGLAELNVEQGNYESGIKLYKRASDYFEMDEHGTSSFSQCILKYADLIARYQENYTEAIKIYETEGKKAIGIKLLQYGAKEHFFKAGILHLLSGVGLFNLCFAVGASSEIALLRELNSSLENRNVDTFVKAIEEFDRIHNLDNWKVHFLYLIKESITEKEATVTMDEEGQIDFT